MGLFFKNGLLLFDGNKFRGCCCDNVCDGICRKKTTIKVSRIRYRECSECYNHRFFTFNIDCEQCVIDNTWWPESCNSSTNRPDNTSCTGNNGFAEYGYNYSWSKPSGAGCGSDADYYDVPGGGGSDTDSGTCGGVSVSGGCLATAEFHTQGFCDIVFNNFASSCSHTHPRMIIDFSITAGLDAHVKYCLSGTTGTINPGNTASLTTGSFDPIGHGWVRLLVGIR